MRIPFNKPYLSGRETEYMTDAVQSGKISGDGKYTALCHQFFEQRYGFKKCLLTTSCTDALEMAALLMDIQVGDEVIVPSYTFVSTANAFVLRGAKIIFCDSQADHPNLDASQLEALITPRTKAIVVVHYAGMACDMDAVMNLAFKHQLVVIEDAAQAIDSRYQGRPLGSIGHLAAFSFHETKNMISGEGGMLVVNDARYLNRAEIIREKGTNRSQFFRGEVDKYGWVDIGSSFLPSDLIAAFLYAQCESLDAIQSRRIRLWNLYNQLLQPIAQTGRITLPHVPDYATNNAHMMYIVCRNLSDRSALIAHLKAAGVYAVFHYLSLHKSPYYTAHYAGPDLPHADRFTDCLLRLPMFYELREEDIHFICDQIQRWATA